MSAVATGREGSVVEQLTLLFVDDEPNSLPSMRRLDIADSSPRAAATLSSCSNAKRSTW